MQLHVGFVKNAGRLARFWYFTGHFLHLGQSFGSMQIRVFRAILGPARNFQAFQWLMKIPRMTTLHRCLTVGEDQTVSEQAAFSNPPFLEPNDL